MKKLIAIAGALALVSGCAWYQKNQAILEEAARGACIVANALLPDADILAKCQLGNEFIALVERLAGEQRASVAKAKAAQQKEDAKAGVCKPGPTASVVPRVPACVYFAGFREAYLDDGEVSQ